MRQLDSCDTRAFKRGYLSLVTHYLNSRRPPSIRWRMCLLSKAFSRRCLSICTKRRVESPWSIELGYSCFCNKDLNSRTVTHLASKSAIASYRATLFKA